jgi:glutamate formiminotransferase
VIEAVPNISEGRDRATIEAVSRAIRDTPGVELLHVTSDADHHRSVFTYVSQSAEAMREATLNMFEAALPRIDLRRHRGEHPRVGAVDVVPFVPLQGRDMRECVALAERVGEEVARRFDLPVYLYEFAARQDYRRELPSIRSGGFENFAQKIQDPRWAPDFGPATVHPSAGVSVIGARLVLIAFNVQLATHDMAIASRIARAVRASSGGLPFVRALPINLRRRGIAQVSMNLLDYRQTSLERVFSAVQQEAARCGVQVLSSEIVGLVPAAALPPDPLHTLKLKTYSLLEGA